MSAKGGKPKMRGRQQEPRIGNEIRSDNLTAPDVDPDRPFPTGRGVLSAAEIEALLRPDLPEVEPVPDAAPRDIPDFENTDAPARETAGRLVSRLSLALRRESEIPLALSLSRLSRHSLRDGLPATNTAGAYLLFGAADGGVDAVLFLDGVLAAGLVEAACGAGPDLVSAAQPRALTRIDCRLLKQIFGPVARHLPGGELLCLETRRAFAMALLPHREAHSLHLEARLDGLTASAHLLLSDWPAPSPQHDFANVPASSGRGPDGLTALLTARIASLSVPVSRLANLKPGDTLLLGLPADEPVQLLSGGRDGALVAEGEVGRKGTRMAVRVRHASRLFHA